LGHRTLEDQEMAVTDQLELDTEARRDGRIGGRETGRFGIWGHTEGVIRFAVLALICAAALLAGSAAAAPAPTIIQLVAVETSSQEKDVTPKGPSKGDWGKGTTRLLNAVRQFGKRVNAVVGHDTGTFTLQGPNSAKATGKTWLPGGTIRFGGKVAFMGGGGFSIPVVGGTGIYAGVRGVLLVAPTSNPKRSINLYRLVYPQTA
jgi:hypothetical protein